MAKVYSPPEELQAPDIADFREDGKIDWKAFEQAEEDFTEKLRESLPRYSKTPKSDLLGYIYRAGYADGNAQYMVLSTRPLELIHLPTGDGYQLPDAHERGLRVKDIRDAKQWEDRFRKTVAKANAAKDGSMPGGLRRPS